MSTSISESTKKSYLRYVDSYINLDFVDSRIVLERPSNSCLFAVYGLQLAAQQAQKLTTSFFLAAGCCRVVQSVPRISSSGRQLQ